MSYISVPELDIYLKRTKKSREVFEEASRFIPGGVNSAIQFFNPYPVYVVKGYGSRLWDVDGNEYIDHCLAYGAMTAGHRNPKIVEAIKKQIEEGGSLLGAPSPKATELAKEISRRIPSIEMIRFTNSGTEATMYAVRLARAVTRRKKIIKMEGAYHGAHDYLLISDKPRRLALMGSIESPASTADSLGTPDEVVKLTIVIHFNDIECLERALKKHENEVAAIVTEAIMTNSGVILPEKDYLKEVRKLCDYHGVLLIIDEVKTGFNAAPSAAFMMYNIEPDLVTLGKVIGGGTPLAAFGGKREFMEEITPIGGAVHYGTYNANPLSVAAGLAALREVFTEEAHERMKKLNEKLYKGVKDALEDTKIKAVLTKVGNMGSIFFGLDKTPKNFREAFRSDKHMWYRYWLGMINKGVIPYGGAWFEEWFVSAMHTEEDIDKTIEKVYETFKELKKI